MAGTHLQETNAANAFNTALVHHQNGRLADAEQYYRLTLSHDPHHSDSLNNLGAIAAQFGHFQVAADLIGAALRASIFSERLARLPHLIMQLQILNAPIRVQCRC
jgi:Tfp pilus assembly protein PilF